MLSSSVILALCSARHRPFRSWIIHASAVLNSRKVRTSTTVCRRSSPLKRDVTFCLLAFLLVWSASVSSSGVRYFPSVLAKVLAFLRLGVVKIFIRRAPYTGIRIFFYSCRFRAWNLIVLSHWNNITFIFSYTGIGAFLTVAALVL